MGHSLKNSQNIKIPLPALKSSLHDLTTEAKQLFDLLDAFSSTICTLEKELQKINVNFPFKLKIHASELSYLKQPLDKHINSCAGIVNGFHTEDVLYFAWGEDSKSKTFRLLMVEEEVEYLFFDYAENIEQIREFCSNIKWQKPFIETDIKTRLIYSKYLIDFVNAFKNELHKWRKAIYVEVDSFFEDSLPF